MLLARGRYWTASLGKSGGAVTLALQRDALPEELADLRDLKLEVGFGRWNVTLKHVLSDRKLLGGILLDFANHEDRLARVIANDRLLAELQRVILDATAALVAEGVLVLRPADEERAGTG